MKLMPNRIYGNEEWKVLLYCGKFKCNLLQMLELNLLLQVLRWAISSLSALKEKKPFIWAKEVDSRFCYRIYTHFHIANTMAHRILELGEGQVQYVAYSPRPVIFMLLVPFHEYCLVSSSNKFCKKEKKESLNNLSNQNLNL